MNYLEVIQEWGRFTNAQVSANAFYICCEQEDKSIEYENASASIYLNSLQSEDIKLLQKCLVEQTRYEIYPHDNQIEIWFY